jgi:hypothetical protein
LKIPTTYGKVTTNSRVSADCKKNVKKFSFLNRTILDWDSFPADLFEPFPKGENVLKRGCKKCILDKLNQFILTLIRAPQICNVTGQAGPN